jgi:hypothetical protein
VSSGKRETKQELIDEICVLLRIGPFIVGNGSTEPAQFFRDLGECLAVDLEGASTKPEIGRKIVESFGLTWDENCDSTSSNSGGGSTVTTFGLSRIKQAVIVFQTSLQNQAKQEFNIRPRTGSLRIFKNLTFKAWYALGEFVDNSITSAIQNIDQLQNAYGQDYSLSVSISFDSVKNCLTVDDNAAGIQILDMARALKTSEPPLDTSKGLSLHGVGMKAAGFWWGERIEIETHPLGESTGWKVSLDLREIDESDNEIVQAFEIPHRGTSGTTVRIQRLWNGVPKGRTPAAIRAFLPSIYRSFLGIRPSVEGTTFAPALDSGVNLKLLYNGEQLFYRPVQLLREKFWPNVDGPADGAEPIAWQDDVVLELATGQIVIGWVGLLDTMSRDRAGFALQYRGKSIAGIAANSEDDLGGVSFERGAYKPRKIFGQPGSYPDQSIVGEFDLSDFGKSITTDSVTWTSEEEDAFVDAVYKFMRNPQKDFIAQANNLRRRKKPQSTIESDQSAIEREITSFSEALTDARIGHGDVEEPSTSEHEDSHRVIFEIENENSEIEESQSFPIHDSEGHIHSLSISYSHRPDDKFLEIVENAALGHKLVINAAHRTLADLAPIEGKVRDMLLRLATAIASAEIFSDGNEIERSKFRRKLNTVLEARASHMRRREGDQ